jgi:hypothetical protein
VNTAALKRCVLKYATARHDELDTCHAGVVHARWMLQVSGAQTAHTRQMHEAPQGRTTLRRFTLSYGPGTS